MSNGVTLYGSRFVIRPERIAECLAAIGMTPVPEPGEASRALAEAFARVSWRLRLDGRGGVDGVEFFATDLRGAELFQRVAPFVEAGSFIDFHQDYAGGAGDRANTRWAFGGSAMAWIDLVPPEERRAAAEAERAWRERDVAAERETERENLLRLERGEPLSCAMCAAYRRPPAQMVPVDYPMPRERPVVVAKAHECPACGATFLPPSEQERFYAAVRAKHDARPR